MDTGITVTTATVRGPISNIQNLSLYQEIGFVNYSDIAIYVRPSYSQTPILLGPTFSTSYNKGTIQVMVRSSPRDDRVHDSVANREVVPEKGYTVDVFTIPIEYIRHRGGYAYLENLDLCFAVNPQKASEHHRKINDNIERYVKDKTKVFEQGLNSAPVKVFGNDSSGSISTIWISINGFTSCVRITNLEYVESNLKVALGLKDEKYDEYDSSIDKLLADGISEIVTDRGVITLATTEFALNNYLFKKSIDKGNTYTKSQIRELTQEAIKAKEKEIESLQIDLKKLKSENASLIEDLKYAEKRADKFEEYTKAMELEREKAKTAKETERMTLYPASLNY